MENKREEKQILIEKTIRTVSQCFLFIKNVEIALNESHITDISTNYNLHATDSISV